jgi:antitoxin HicB
MKTYLFSALFEPGEENGITVSFPDLPEAITQGVDDADARRMAEEVLGLALLERLAQNKPLPEPTAEGRELVPIGVHPSIAAKLAVIEAVRAAGLTQAELAFRLGKDAREVRRILNPNHPTKLSTLDVALKALGQRLVVGVMAA